MPKVVIKDVPGLDGEYELDLTFTHRDFRTIKQIATHSTWKHVSGPKLGPSWGPRTNTGYWGVTANGAGNRFTVSLYHDGRKYAFGWFKDVVEAARAYDAKACELGLPPDRLNFPDGN